MDNHKVRHNNDGRYRRVEEITGVRRRKQWLASEKAQIVAESFFPGVNISEVARRSGVSVGILFRWRREALARSSASSVPPTFTPVTLAVEPEEAPQQEHDCVHLETCSDSEPGVIEIELSGALIRLQGLVNEAALRTVLAAVRGAA
jgi:transposase